MFPLSAFIASSIYLAQVHAFTSSNYDNVAVYWGQNSYGAANPTGTAGFQQPISYYCQDDAIDAIPVAFVNTFFGTGGLPSMNLANTCNPTDNATFPGTGLANCSALASDIEYCQAQGKIVTISLGGAGGSVGFTDDTEAQTFAQTIWDLYLGGTSTTRPFGAAVLDGVDLDIENGGSTGYAAFVTEIRSLSSGASKPYYITAAPQCPFPDQNLGSVIDQVGFDAIYVQFYNNVCGLQNYNVVADWDFGTWDMWASQVSPNPDVKIYVGAPASSTAAGTGYQSISNLSTIATTMRKSFPSFGGVMLWDASQAYDNDRYDLGIKNALVAAGATGFTYPACTAPAYVSGSDYTGGSQVSYNGYMWQADYWTNATPSNSSSGDWSAISVCTGTSTATPTSTSSAASTSATSSTACSGIAAWSSSAVYTAGDEVSYNGNIYTANYWTESNIPSGTSGSWTEVSSCTTTTAARMMSRFFRF
ncbi:glycoside hydrolase family 18 protein [Serpula lacrymans var. lacrymans S7.3]|uniref:chitinase n=2 Tax=Serpula lacrymans var. lacrymans TaxID=341189 RepID=F8Q0H2_SERL3|nr:glycoside hydrolase family 18 protein [Serpula lacrymans var. lacrymans S7.9]EGN97801.1 glycoside hydrolase family 18 protein [Serpula lacrymans var. lacrymans S7.3]EGO23393.1 glycoside hydrolase family 18 protein [Serpula lacrymans var. lacrymans S7.9]